MQRRSFIMLLGGAIAAFPLPLPVRRPFAAARGANPAGASKSGQVGQVATVQGTATVGRGDANASALAFSDPIFRNDALATGAASFLGITFDDQTTFSLRANTRIVINEFVYQETGRANAAAVEIAAGTAAFMASLVAKTGDMTITTPVATLGIRGTTGIVEVPQGGAATGAVSEPRIKLYADADGHLGRIEVFDRQGRQLGVLTQGTSAFALRPGAGGRLEAVPFRISPEDEARDRGLLQRLRTAHNIGRRMTIERLRSRGLHQRQPGNLRLPGRPPPPYNRNPRGNRPPRRENRH